MLFKRLKTQCGRSTPYSINPKRGEKTKCGFFSRIKTSIDGVKIIDIDAIAAAQIFRSISLPLTRRVFPSLFAQNVVRVQPMTGPVGLAFALRYMNGEILERFNELV